MLKKTYGHVQRCWMNRFMKNRSFNIISFIQLKHELRYIQTGMCKVKDIMFVLGNPYQM